MFNKKYKKEEEKPLILGFQHIEQALKRGRLFIEIDGVKSNTQDTTREVLLKHNVEISMFLNMFLKAQENSYVNDYISSIEKLNRKVTTSHFDKFMQNSDRNIQEQIAQQVEEDFNAFCKKYVEMQKARQQLQEQIDINLSKLFLKIEQILEKTEIEIKKSIPVELKEQLSKFDSDNLISSSKAYKSLAIEFKQKPEQLAFITGILRSI